MKPPEWRQERARYPHTCMIQTRYADEDRFGHVNNIAIAGYYARSALGSRGTPAPDCNRATSRASSRQTAA